jgi:hypothetical protein
MQWEEIATWTLIAIFVVVVGWHPLPSAAAAY